MPNVAAKHGRGSLRVRFGSKSRIFTVLMVAGKAHEVSQINVKEKGAYDRQGF